MIGFDTNVLVRYIVQDDDARTAEFADCLIAARNHPHGCAETYTFDRRAVRGRSMTLVP